MREVRMTFGEHLEDLRSRILWAILWLSVAVIICFIYGKGLLKLTMGPHEVAIRGAVRDRAANIIESKGKELLAFAQAGPPPSEPGTEAEPSGWEELFAVETGQKVSAGRLQGVLQSWAPKILPAAPPAEREGFVRDLSAAIGGAIAEEGAATGARSLPASFRLLEEDLRNSAKRGGGSVQRLIGVGKSLEEAIAPLEAFNRLLEERRKGILEAAPSRLRSRGAPSEFVRRLEGFYDDIRVQARTVAEDTAKPPIAISYLESFMTYFKVALVFGLFFATPMILYEMWKFVGAGLYPNEQRYILIFLPFSVALFIGGALFGYWSVIPVALGFLASWGADMVDMSFTISSYVGLFFTLTVLLGLVFQTPLVMIFFGKVGLVSADGFRKARKYAIFGALVFAGVVTPPDPMSWTLVAGPMIILYEFGIILVGFVTRKKGRPAKEESKEPEPAGASPGGPS
jgi:Tat protein translocase TatC